MIQILRLLNELPVKKTDDWYALIIVENNQIVYISSIYWEFPQKWVSGQSLIKFFLLGFSNIH